MRHDHFTMTARHAIKNALSSISEDSRIGVGVSGGADSLALMVGLSTLYRGDRASLVRPVIIDHGLQEETSQVASQTAAICAEMGFHADIVPVDITETASGMESDARRARYGAFEQKIAEYGLDALLLGHTKSDQAEQVVLGMIRGSGTRSLAGMPEVREVYRRPFLHSLSRQDTEKVCEEAGLQYWSDPHNEDTAYRRVSVRKFLNSAEQSTGSNLVDPLVRTAQIAAEDAEALDFYADIAYEKVVDAEWSVDALSSLPVSVRKRVIRRRLLEMVSSSDTVTFEIVQRVESFISEWYGQKAVSVAGGVSVERRGRYLLFSQL